MRFFNSLNAFLAFASLTMSVITATPDSKRIKLARGLSTRITSPWNLNGSYSEPGIAFEINCKSNLLPNLI